VIPGASRLSVSDLCAAAPPMSDVADLLRERVSRIILYNMYSLVGICTNLAANCKRRFLVGVKSPHSFPNGCILSTQFFFIFNTRKKLSRTLINFSHTPIFFHTKIDQKTFSHTNQLFSHEISNKKLF
jgi:hypothetical protein